MRELLAALLLLAAGSASANPMLRKCLPFAPKECALTEASTPEDFLACFGEKKLFIETGKGEGACAEELAHARVHKACSGDIPAVCADVKPGENRTMSCLRMNRAKLSPDCLKALKRYDALTSPAAGGERKKGRGKAGVAAVRC